jgi:O-antigen/teichoic acid export membrane protein
MLLASILVARLLGQTVFGEFGMIRSTVSMFVVFAGFGLGMTATKHIAEHYRSDPGRAGRIWAISEGFALASGVLIAILVILFAPWLAESTINAPHLVPEIRIGACILLINGVNGAQTGALAGFEAFRAMAVVNLWSGLASFPLLVGGAYWGGVRGSVWALLVNMLLNCLLNHLALRRVAAHHKVAFTLRGCTRELPVLWRFSLPAALSGIMVSPVLWGGNALLVNRPGGYEQLAIFDAANQWRIAILFIPGMVGQVVLPMLSSLTAEDDALRYWKILKYNVILNFALSLAAAGLVAASAPWIMRGYGPGFEAGRWVLVLLAFSSVVISISQVVGQVLVSKGEMWTGFGINVLWAATLLLVGEWLLSKGYGALGLAVAYSVAYLLHMLWVGLYVWRSASGGTRK